MTLPVVLNYCGVNSHFALLGSIPAHEDNSKRSLADTELIFLYDGIEGQRNRIGSISVSFNNPPAAPTVLLVKFGSRLVYQLHLNDIGPFFIPFVPPMMGDIGESLEISIEAAGPGVRTRANVHVWQMSGTAPY